MSVTLGYLALGLFSLGSVNAAATGTTKHCVQIDVPVEVSANNTKYDTLKVDSNLDVPNFIWDVYTWSHQNKSRDLGPLPVEDTFTINAQLCVPDNGEKSHILQIATHGGGFDMTYWDVDVEPEQYSYVDAAINQGYAILTYDRLGNGGSSKPNGYEVVQFPVQAEIIKKLTELARAGQLVKSSKVKGNSSVDSALRTYKPSKVVHVGHSFGSVITSLFLNSHGSLSDGAVLTGYLIPNANVPAMSGASLGLEFAAENNPERFAGRPSGYLVQGTQNTIQQFFLGGGEFETELLKWSFENREILTIGEMFSAATAGGKPAETFTGPVQFFVGEYDFPFCSGDCNNAYDIDVLRGLYPATSVYIQPKTAHGLAVSKNATAGYEVIHSYLEAQGL